MGLYGFSLTFLPFATKTTASGLSTYDGARLVNYFARPSEGVGPVALIGCGGFVAEADVGAQARAMLTHNQLVHVVAGGKLWSISGSVATNLGAVADDPNTTMASNGTEIAVVAAGRYFLYSGGSVTEIATGSVTTPRGVVFAYGFFVVIGDTAVRRDAATISGLNDGSTFLGLDLFNAERSPDAIVGVLFDHTRLLLFGERTLETFGNTGDADQPFQPEDGLMSERGCLDQRTIAKDDNRTFWVGNDNIVYAYGGSVPQAISTPEIGEIIERGTVEGGLVYKTRGHKFYAIRMTGGTTLCYDMTTGLWSERSTGAGHDSWIVTHSCILNGVQYVATSTGKVGQISDDVYTDDGAVIAAEAVSSAVVRGGNLFSLGFIHASFATGRLDAGREAQAVLQLSDDGQTWGRERTRSLGRLGEREKLVRWHGLGSHRRVQARLKVTDPVQRDLHGIQYG